MEEKSRAGEEVEIRRSESFVLKIAVYPVLTIQPVSHAGRGFGFDIALH